MLNLVEIPEPSRFRIGNLFQDNNFLVPLFQRNFAWQVKEMDDFWGDLLELSEGRRSSHFFGQIVSFRNPDGNQELIDGQQRLTSSSILLATMRDLATKISADHRDEISPDASAALRDIQLEVRKYLRGEGDQPSLILQKRSHGKDELDTNAYFEYLVHGVLHKAYSEPTKNMHAAYAYFVRTIEKEMRLFATWSERIEWLSRTFRSFVEDFYVVMISAPTQKDAFIIFETLNGRGKDLSASDVIKNHLMYLANTDIDHAHAKWDAISHQLKDDSKRITKFIRTYWIARRHMIAESHLYRELSNELVTGAQGNEFLDDLQYLVGLFAVLEIGTVAQRRKFFAEPELTHQIDIMLRMQIRVCYPVLFAMAKRGYERQDVIIVLQKLISVVMRHRVILKNSSRRLELGFGSLAEKIWTGELSSQAMISQDLNQNLLQPDAKVKGAFLNMFCEGGVRGPKKWTLVYLMSQLYDEALDERAFNHDEFLPVHIVSNLSSPGIIDYVGNWTLIEKKFVTEYEEAADITTKVQLLKRSGIEANQKLAKILHAGWDERQILKRQKQLANQAIVVW